MGRIIARQKRKRISKKQVNVFFRAHMDGMLSLSEESINELYYQAEQGLNSDLKDASITILHSAVKACFENNYLEAQELIDRSFDVEKVKTGRSALKSSAVKECYEYLRSLAALVHTIVPENERTKLKPEGEEDYFGEDFNFLEQQYEEHKYIDVRSIANSFLGGDLKEPHSLGIGAPIFPFGFNLSQMKAVERALDNSLSIIEGPPGTGKTQTILNIVANVLINGGNVAIVSGNNSATRNVQEKLEQNNYGFISAFLGSAKNIKLFIDNQKELPNLDSWTHGNN